MQLLGWDRPICLTELTYDQIPWVQTVILCWRLYIPNQLHISSLRTRHKRRLQHLTLSAMLARRLEYRAPFFVHWMRSAKEISKSSVQIQTHLCALESIDNTCSWLQFTPMKSVVRSIENFTTRGRNPEPPTAIVQLIESHNNTQGKPICCHRNF